MSQNKPSTTIKVPAAAANYTPATMDPDLRSQINSLLLKDGHVQNIQDRLNYSLNAHANNWPTQVQNRALSLLRSGEVTSFSALFKQILEDVRKETMLDTRPPHSNPDKANGTSSAEPTVQVNGKKTTNGAGAGPGPGEASNLYQNSSASLAVPRAVIEEALKVTREALESVCEIEEKPGAT